jgi:hypothetical protein
MGKMNVAAFGACSIGFHVNFDFVKTNIFFQIFYVIA